MSKSHRRFAYYAGTGTIAGTCGKYNGINDLLDLLTEKIAYPDTKGN